MVPAPRMSEMLDESSPLLEGSISDLDPTKVATVENEPPPLWRRAVNEVHEQLDTAVPTLQAMVLNQIPWLISLRFVGEIGTAELAAAALATTLCNVTGLSLSIGLSSALSTLAGQAKGELLSRPNKHDDEDTDPESFSVGTESEDPELRESEPITTVVFLLRGMIVQLAIMIPIGVWWLYGVESTLIYLGQAELLSSMTQDYLRVLVPGLWGFSVNWTLTAWCQSIGMTDIPATAAVIAVSLHVPFNYFFIYYMGWGYLGCAVATVCFQLLQPIYVVACMFCRADGRKRVLESTGGTAIGRTRLTFWPEFRIAASSLKGYLQYAELAVPGVVIISEWWASEVVIFLSGQLSPRPDVAVASMSLYQSINGFCFVFSNAFSVAAATRVGNMLGLGDARQAAFAADISLGSAAVLSSLLGLLLYMIPHTFIPSLFAPDQEEVIYETSRTIPFLAIYVFADGIQVTLNGIIKGCGRQCITTPIVLFAYWVVAVPLAYYLAFIRHEREMYCDGGFCGVAGLVAGMTTGTWLHMLLMAAVVGITTNWSWEAEKAKLRVADKY